MRRDMTHMTTEEVRVRGHIQPIYHQGIKMFKPQTYRVLEVHCTSNVEIGGNGRRFGGLNGFVLRDERLVCLFKLVVRSAWATLLLGQVAPPVATGERRAPWKSSRDGRPSMTQTAHAFSQNVILFGRPARQPPLCQGI